MENIQPQVIWFTGLSGSGKTTLAKHLENDLKNLGYKTYLIDGDILRQGMQHDLGFSKEDRSKNVIRAVRLAQEKLALGFTIIVAMISPFKKDRAYARSQFMPSQFKEVYVSTPLSVCENRDPKGLYKKTREGLILDMTGIHSPYEPPSNPDIIIDTSNQSIESSIEIIMQAL